MFTGWCLRADRGGEMDEKRRWRREDGGEEPVGWGVGCRWQESCHCCDLPPVNQHVHE